MLQPEFHLVIVDLNLVQVAVTGMDIAAPDENRSELQVFRHVDILPLSAPSGEEQLQPPVIITSPPS